MVMREPGTVDLEYLARVLSWPLYSLLRKIKSLRKWISTYRAMRHARFQAAESTDVILDIEYNMLAILRQRQCTARLLLHYYGKISSLSLGGFCPVSLHGGRVRDPESSYVSDNCFPRRHSSTSSSHAYLLPHPRLVSLLPSQRKLCGLLICCLSKSIHRILLLRVNIVLTFCLRFYSKLGAGAIVLCALMTHA